jgi:transposase
MRGVPCDGSEKRICFRITKKNVNFTELCAKYCISPKTGYKWKRRFIEQGFAGLEELSRRPKSNPVSLTEDEIFAIIKIKS